jgi:NAD(P)-dependent dehydrogenase (short-subunit alcohol dehydrogenase family)
MNSRGVMLVTGASRGIGAAVARAASAAGFRVAINYATGAAEATALADELGSGCFTVQADIANDADVAAMFDEVDRVGPLHALVNNAGISGPYGTIAEPTADDLARLWAVNITGPFLCSRRAVERFDAQGGGGVIVNVSSKAAVIGGAGEWVHYATSKGALESMTTGMARELAARNIRVNAVRPGLVDNNFGSAPDDRLERLRPMIPMQRVGSLDEVAEAVLWLAADAPSYITGTFIDVTGGR